MPSDEQHMSKSPSLSALNNLQKPSDFNHINHSFSDTEDELDMNMKQEVKEEIKLEPIEKRDSPMFFVPLKPLQPSAPPVILGETKVKKPRLNSVQSNENGSKNVLAVCTPLANNVIDSAVQIKEEDLIVHHQPQYQNIQEQKPPVLVTTSIVKAEKPLAEKSRNFINVANYTPTKPLKAATLSDLEGIDMMHLPVDLDDSGHIDILTDISDVKQELMQETHLCFLSLIRDIFCSTQDHRTTIENLRSKVSVWLANPITALNDWFSQADSWLALLPSAVHFLAGEFLDQPEEFVPYLEYKANLQIYQWIGAGRDSDQHLRPLCEYWLKRRNEMGTKPPPKHQTEPGSIKSKHSNSSLDLEESLSNSGNSTERLASPPPPRCPTSWMVNKASAAEIAEFREQERKRFENPHLSFTYRMHGFESVVGPVKGIYTQIPALTKARGHNMLTADRPNFVTILTLVRDATARLPNGEGTRADICELLKSSQYICPSAAETVLQTIVSGALDRMHTEHDPCVRYDTKRKIWIYLHRGRTEEEFERMHQQFQGVSKHKKQNSRKIKTKLTSSKSPTPKRIESSVDSLNEIASPGTPPAAMPKKKLISNPAASPAIAVIPNNQSATAIKVQAIGAPTIQLAQNQQPVIITTVPPMPALSSIQNPGIVHSVTLPPLLNKIVQKKTFVKPELVPIKPDNAEIIDVEASLDVHATPIPVKKTTKQSIVKQVQPMPSLVMDKGQKLTNKNIVKPVVSILSSSTTTPIKVSTPSGIQTVHVSAAHQALSKPTIATILTSANNQSVLASSNQNRPQSPLRKVVQKAPPPLIAQSTPTSHGFVTIPISMSKTNQQIKQLQAVVTTMASSKIQKAALPALTSTAVPRMSLLQAQQPINKTIVRNTTPVPGGKSLISPTAANNLALQQQIQSQQVWRARFSLLCFYFKRT